VTKGYSVTQGPQGKGYDSTLHLSLLGLLWPSVVSEGDFD